MSTRCCIAKPWGESWRGRYVHSDGYPTGVGVAIKRAVDRLGSTKAAIKLLIDSSWAKAGWSAIDAPTIDFALPPSWPYTGAELQGPVSYAVRGEAPSPALTPATTPDVIGYVFVIHPSSVHVLHFDQRDKDFVHVGAVPLFLTDAAYFDNMALIEKFFEQLEEAR